MKKRAATSGSIIGRRVFVYRNLHRKCWSVRDVRTRRVIAHLDTLTLSDCSFVVSEAGRQRVLRNRCKNVHAGVQGILVSVGPRASRGGRRVRYDPYTTASFVTLDGDPVHSAAWVSFETKRVRAGA